MRPGPRDKLMHGCALGCIFVTMLHMETSINCCTAAATLPYYDLPRPFPVWLWMDYDDNPHYKSGMPAYMQLNLQALARNAPSSDFVIHKLNHNNILDFIPGT